jgi:hypothetical protein
MPAEARPRARRLPSGRWQLRYTVAGEVRSGGAFATKTDALNHFRDVIEPELQGRAVTRRDVTLTELVDTYLERHGTVAKPATIATLRWRMKRPLNDFGDTVLVDLEQMTDEIAGFAAKLPERFRYSVMAAFRQTCAAGMRYGYMTQNPAKLAGRNPSPPPRPVRVFSPDELETLCEELDRRGSAVDYLRRRDWPATVRVGTCRATRRRPDEAHPHRARYEDDALVPRGSANCLGTPRARLARRPPGLAIRVRRSQARAVRRA